MTNGFEKSLNGLKGSVNWSNTESVAKYHRKLNEISSVIEERMAESKKILLERKETIIIPEFKEKVVYQEGRDRSSINASKAGSYFVREKREEDLYSVISITEKALKNLPDGDFIVAKFKEISGTTAPSIRVSKMTKKELKEFQI